MSGSGGFVIVVVFQRKGGEGKKSIFLAAI